MFGVRARHLSPCCHPTTVVRYLSSYSLNKNLKLRGIIFTLEVLVGSSTTVISAPAPSPSVPTTKPSVVYDTSREIEGISTVQSKYMSKISSKLGGTNPLVGSAQAPRGDGDLHSAGKALLKQESQRSGKKSASESGRWVLSQGMGAIVDYASSRTMNVCVLGLPTQTQGLLNALVEQTPETPWLYTGKVSGEPSSELQRAEKKFAAKAAGVIEPRHLLFISSDDTYLGLAKERGFMTCRYRPKDGLYGQVSTDFSATSALELQDALEELNGVALRGSAYGSRAF